MELGILLSSTIISSLDVLVTRNVHYHFNICIVNSFTLNFLMYPLLPPLPIVQCNPSPSLQANSASSCSECTSPSNCAGHRVDSLRPWVGGATSAKNTKPVPSKDELWLWPSSSNSFFQASSTAADTFMCYSPRCILTMSFWPTSCARTLLFLCPCSSSSAQRLVAPSLKII